MGRRFARRAKSVEFPFPARPRTIPIGKKRMREKSNFGCPFKLIWAVQYLSFVFTEYDVCSPRSATDQGTYRDRHERGAECGGREVCRSTSGTRADGEVVWSWRPKVWRSSPSEADKLRADDGGKRDGSPGRARISRKPLRREGRLSPPVPVVFALAQIFFAREPRVHAATRPSLCPPFFWRVM
jgi:hypothetical protein